MAAINSILNFKRKPNITPNLDFGGWDLLVSFSGLGRWFCR